jgi:hypothetical protein
MGLCGDVYIYCHLESECRPEAEFQLDDAAGLVHRPRNLPPHTLLGDPVRPGALDPVPTLAAE